MIIIRKRVLIAILCVLTVLFSVSIIITCAADKISKIKIIVDAGHGEPDGGAIGISGSLEKDINLAISLKLSEVLEGRGYEVIMTREGDEGVFSADSKTIREKKRSDMNKRLNIMKNSDSDLFLSIHMNSFENKKAEGLNIFYSSNHPEIMALGERIQARMAEMSGATAHSVRVADTNLFLMKNPPIPAILVECGFLSNPNEEKKLMDSDYQARLAWAIADAVDDYFMDS